ncbi:MAG: hypothetical protein KDC24_12445 [Saprospiraceae bacterium]|nr:hypothetical protein [Saprospiraceae bacterium]
MKLFLSGLSIVAAIFILGACNEDPQNVDKKPLNPNGDSELAILMREMFDEGMMMKDMIKNGDHPEVNVEFQKILTAEATEPEKAASPEFKAFAQTYINTMEAMKDASPEDKLVLYDTMVENCMTCHEALCPGPNRRIKKLKM